MLNKLIRSGILAAIIFCCGTTCALTFEQIGNIYFFGDSLTDGGFNNLWTTAGDPPDFPTLPTGKAPTFTTFGGYVWAQYVAHDIKGTTLPIYPGPTPVDTITNNSCCSVDFFSSGNLTGFNYASAGSTTNSSGVTEIWAPSLKTQVSTFLTSGTVIHPNDVFFIWSGADDLLATLNSTPASDYELEYAFLTAARNATTNIASEVAYLSSRGAKRFVILSLPNIGRSPLVTSVGDPYFVKAAKHISFTYDTMLNQQLGMLATRYDVKVLYIDVYSLLDRVIETANAGGTYYVQGQGFRFTNTTQAACGDFVPAVQCTVGSNGYVFADMLHPTDMAHRLIALQVEAEIKNWQ